MANRRMISSDIWEDDWFGQLDFFEQALWIGLFSKCADDQGRLLDNPVLIRAAVFPYKDIPPVDIDLALVAFANATKIVRYEQGGKRLIQIVRWWENQQPQWASASKWSPPEGWTDRIRTRQNNHYVEINWKPRPEFTLPVQVNAQGEPTSNDTQLVGQYPVPVPDPVSVPIDTEVGASAPVATPPPAKLRQNSRTDPRSKTVAIKAVLVLTRKYPPIELYDKLIAALGETPDEPKLRLCRETWLQCGYNPNAWTWALDWYRDGIPARGNGHGARASPAKHDATAADWQAEAQKFAPIIVEEDA